MFGVSLSLLLAATAPAKKTVAVLPPTFEGALESHWREELRSRIARGFAQADLQLVDAEPLAAAAAACTEQNCLKQAFGATPTDVVVMSAIAIRERDFEISLRALSGRDATTLASVEQTCGLCGAQEAAEMAEDLAATMRAKLDALAKAPPVIQVSSKPAGATIFIDGKRVGTTPLSLEVAPGKHTIRLELGGFAPQTRTVTAIAGVKDSVAMGLLEQAAPIPSWERPARIAGWTAFAAGLGGVAAGATLLALHKRPYRRPCSPDGDGDCRYLYNTQTPGAISVAVGGAALITGVALVAAVRSKAGRTRRSSARARISPALGGVVVRF